MFPPTERGDIFVFTEVLGIVQVLSGGFPSLRTLHIWGQAVLCIAGPLTTNITPASLLCRHPRAVITKQSSDITKHLLREHPLWLRTSTSLAPPAPFLTASPGQES